MSGPAIRRRTENNSVRTIIISNSPFTLPFDNSLPRLRIQKPFKVAPSGRLTFTPETRQNPIFFPLHFTVLASNHNLCLYLVQNSKTLVPHCNGIVKAEKKPIMWLLSSGALLLNSKAQTLFLSLSRPSTYHIYPQAS